MIPDSLQVIQDDQEFGFHLEKGQISRDSIHLRQHKVLSKCVYLT